jgi:DNA invertase Pin-like site-specific DNA recombinase
MGYRLSNEHVWNDGAQKSYTLNRPGLQTAFEAIRKQEIQVLVVGRYDRFSRIQLQQAVAIYQIEKVYGGRVESTDPREQFGRDSTGTLLRSVNAWRAEQELDLIRARTQGGRRSRAQSGKLIAAPFPLYGYQWADPDARRGKSRYTIDPETAPIVERIIREVAAGIPIHRVAFLLIEEHVPTPAQVLIARGLITHHRFKMTAGWSRTMIQRIAANPAYCGQYVAFRTKTTTVNEHDDGGQMQVRTRTSLRHHDDPARTVLSEEVCPPIVTVELWSQAKEQLTRNMDEAARGNKHSEATLLRGGYSTCGYCGARMTSSSIGPPGKKYHQYRCQTRGYVVSPCTGGAFGMLASVLDQQIWLAIQHHFSDPARVRKILETLLDDQSEVHARAEERKCATVGQLADVQTQLDNAKKAVLLARDDHARALWSEEVERLLPQREGLLTLRWG